MLKAFSPGHTFRSCRKIVRFKFFLIFVLFVSDVNDISFGETINDWLMADDDSDLDLDGELEADARPLTQRNAGTEPACPTDMTELQTQVLQAEGDINDQLLRDLMTDEDYYRFDWKRDRTVFKGHRETFTGSSGPTFDVTNDSIVDVFYKMIDSDFIDRL